MDPLQRLGDFEESLERSRLLDGVRRLLVAVSGGPDSIALLHLLASLRARRGPERFPALLVGHVHHGLRGADADADAAFVRGVAAAHGLEILVHRGDARAEAMERGLSPEAAARSLRYRVLGAWAVEARLDAVALAHHLDDQAETVLLRAVRGTGIRGLAGIPESRLLTARPRVRLIRPLLGWTRESILAYLSAVRQPYRTDSSNLDLGIPRNRVRHEILPLLERWVHPGARRSLHSLGLAAGSLARDIRSLGRRCFREARVAGPRRGILLDIETLRSWPGSVLDEAFRLAVVRAAAAGEPGRGPGAPEVRLPRTALDVLVRWVARDPRGARLSFGPRVLAGKRCTFEARYGLIRVRVEDPAPAAPEGDDPAALAPGGTARWRGWTFGAAEEAAAGETAARGPAPVVEERSPASIVERFDAACLASAGPLRVRSRREGDRFHPLGAPGSKTLKEFFRERKVWPSDRRDVPLLAAGGSIAWVVGHRIAEPFRVRPGTRRVLAVTARPPADR
jgi:tRNA(Ile)-lysidine synthase